MNDIIIENIEEHCQRCGNGEISESGKCAKCGFKCWHAFH